MAAGYLSRLLFIFFLSLPKAFQELLGMPYGLTILSLHQLGFWQRSSAGYQRAPEDAGLTQTLLPLG